MKEYFRVKFDSVDLIHSGNKMWLLEPITEEVYAENDWKYFYFPTRDLAVKYLDDLVVRAEATVKEAFQSILENYEVTKHSKVELLEWYLENCKPISIKGFRDFKSSIKFQKKLLTPLKYYKIPTGIFKYLTHANKYNFITPATHKDFLDSQKNHDYIVFFSEIAAIMKINTLLQKVSDNVNFIYNKITEEVNREYKDGNLSFSDLQKLQYRFNEVKKVKDGPEPFSLDEFKILCVGNGFRVFDIGVEFTDKLNKGFNPHG